MHGKVLFNGKPDKRYYSKKFDGPGLRYEIGLAIRSSAIVWIAGSYLPGQWNDIMIFRDGLMGFLEPGERVEASGTTAPAGSQTVRHYLEPYL